MEIKFELNEKQEKALLEILPLLSAQKKADIKPEVFAKEVLIEVLIKNKQLLVAQELK
jgi:hypothetical protein